MQQVNVNDNTTTTISTFDYNPTFLPNYNAAQTDHWGYYNGKPSLFNFTGGDVGTYVRTNIDNYYNYRQPDVNYMKAEVLQQINYPTGGYTKFEYEPHDYNAAVTRDLVRVPVGTNDKNRPYSLKNDYTTKQEAGGLRIQKITSNDGTQSITKEYQYVKNYTSLLVCLWKRRIALMQGRKLILKNLMFRLLLITEVHP